jgi:two-component system, OmpR family, sensor histidine kinase ChvG
MASVIDTASRERRRRHRPVSPLTLRILAVNLLALAIPVGGLLYLGDYQDRLLQTELKALVVEARIFASALGEGAVLESDGVAVLEPEAGRQMVRRLVETTETRTRLYGLEGRLVADSIDFGAAFSQIRVRELPSPAARGPLAAAARWIRALLLDGVPGGDEFPAFREEGEDGPSMRTDLVLALDGEDQPRVWRIENGGDGAPRLLLTAAAPVQHYRQVQGAVVVMRGSEGIDAAIRSVRLDILRVFGVTLAVTVLLSVYLAGTIARPVRRLAGAAERLRLGLGRHAEIPDFTARRDEIGDLSGVLRAMVAALRGRMDAIERFAADVAHEIKNPLTSLRSAVETAERVDDPARRARLMAIVTEDIQRLDRLITDISRASRLDAELNRAEPEPVDVGALIAALAEIRAPEAMDETEPPRVVVERGRGEDLTIPGLAGRLSQVFENLIANAVSFSPPGGVVRLTAGRSGADVVVTVTDEGPGIPEGKERTIFDRFYSQRPAGEKFGTHSGLGLSICRQIVDAHRGAIDAHNRKAADGRVLGAVFTVRLPRGGNSV